MGIAHFLDLNLKMKEKTMKIIKNTILASMLLVGIGSTAVAGDYLESGSGMFAALTWSPDTDSGTIEGKEYDGSGMIGVLIGHKKLITDNIGAYFGGDFSYTKVDDSGTSNEAIYSYRIVNVGATFTPMESLTLMGGIGYTTEHGEFSYYGTHYESEEDHSQMNFHIGGMYNITNQFGLVIGYNTAPSAINYGVSFSF